MKWYNFIFGYLNILITSPFIENIINMILARGVNLWDVERKGENQVLVKVQLGSVWQLIGVVRKCKGRMKIVNRKGFPFLVKRANRRKGLILGFCLCLSMIYILSSFIWTIEVKGNEYYSDRDIIKMAEAQGIIRGKVVDQIDLEEVEKKMIEENPDLGWIRIDAEGTKIKIEVKEKNIVRGEDTRPADIIAKRDGVVKEMLVLVGTAVVDEGERVYEGEILIQGLSYPERMLNSIGEYEGTGSPDLVKAKGMVKAEVEYSERGQCPLNERINKKTGNVEKKVELLIGQQAFVLYGPEELPDTYVDQQMQSKKIFSLQNGEITIRLRSTIYEERQQQEQEYTVEEAYYKAVEDAEKQLAKKMHKDGQIIDKEVKIIPTEGQNPVIVEVTWKVVEDIGKLSTVTKSQFSDSYEEDENSIYEDDSSSNQ